MYEIQPNDKNIKEMNKTNFPGYQRFQFVNTSTMEEELILAKDLIDAKNKLCQKLFGIDYFTEDALEGWELQMAQG